MPKKFYTPVEDIRYSPQGAKDAEFYANSIPNFDIGSKNVPIVGIRG
jgi:hypothetical protein